MPVKIQRVDPHDDTALASWHAAMDAGARAGRQDPPIWRLPELRVRLRDTDPHRERDDELYAAIDDDGTVVGTGCLALPRLDNLAMAVVDVNVPPEHRRRGVGTALVERLLERSRELERTSLVTEVVRPVEVAEVPGEAFAAQHGFTRRNVEMQRVLSLPVKAELLDEMAAEAEPHMRDYTIKTWQGPCPDEYAEQYAHLKSLLLTEAPTGDLEFEQSVWDVQRLRAEEAVTAKQDRTMLTAVAVAADGSLAGHTQLAVPHHDSTKSYQWDTLVLTAHRGHRLGVALKLANLRALMAAFPDRTTNTTWNAIQNGPMNAVNDRLGFVSVERFEEWQRGR